MARGGFRVGAGRPKGSKGKTAKSKRTTHTTRAAGTGTMTPLEFMLAVMRDPKQDRELRTRMAVAAAPYIHTRAGEGKGKKNDQADKAKKAGAGKFAQGKAPLKVVQ